MGGRALTTLLLQKVREQVETTDRLMAAVPADRLEWRPSPDVPAFTTGILLGHLLDCVAGVCAVLYAAHPDRLAHFLALRELPVNHVAGAEEARVRLAGYVRHIEEGFALLSDEDLARVLPTVFTAGGEAVMTLLLGNLEHLMNHKFQLFHYLKLMGVPLGTADLYVLRGERGAAG
jgi:uncharacterized damage-inducible protein DinB